MKREQDKGKSITALDAWKWTQRIRELPWKDKKDNEEIQDISSNLGINMKFQGKVWRKLRHGF